MINQDGRLKALANPIAQTADLASWRGVLNPPASHWWWYVTPTVKVGAWDRLDWLWNGVTVFCLALSGSLMVSLFNGFSVGGGARWPGTFMTLIQGTGLALVAGGSLTTTGQKNVEKALEKFNIPPELRAEVTMGFALILLLLSSGTYNLVPKYLLYLGTRHYDQGDLILARRRLSQATQLLPDNPNINIALGQVHESLGDNNAALAEYRKAIPEGLPSAFNAAGRVNIGLGQAEVAESLLRLGLQRAFIRGESKKAEQAELANIRYQLRRNLGWVLLNQERYQEAKRQLVTAVRLNQDIAATDLGSGLAQCFLMQVNLELGDRQAAEENWYACRDLARPEFIKEYQWFVDNGYENLANCLDTSGIVAGLESINTNSLSICADEPNFPPPEANPAPETES